MKSDLNGSDLGDISDVGEVDMFGLDEFGNEAGPSAVWGAVAGTAIATGTAMAVRNMTTDPSWYQWSEGIGLLAGIVSGGAMMAFPGTRRLGVGAIAAALVGNGLRQLEQFFGTGAAVNKQLSAVQAAAAGAPALGYAVIDPAKVLQGRGLGLATIQPTKALHGTMPKLLGPNADASRRGSAQLVGVPGLAGSLSGIAGNFGATLFGGR